MGASGYPQGTTPMKYDKEAMMESFVATQTRQNDDFRNKKFHINEVFRQQAIKIESMSTHNMMLETQISQIAQQQASTPFPQGSFLGQPKQNPRDT